VVIEFLGYCSLGSVVTPTQLRCDASDGIFSKTLLQIVDKDLKIHEYLVKIWAKISVSFFGQPCSSVIMNRRS